MRRPLMGMVAAATWTLASGLGTIAEARSPEDAVKSGVDGQHVDAKVRPQDDLFRHVNGKWLAEATIPADRPLDGSFYKLRDQSESDLRAIIESTTKLDNPPGSDARKVGDLFASFMDEALVERLGLGPIKPELDEVAATADKQQLVKTLGRLQKLGVDGIFGLFVNTDAKQSDRYIAYLSQSGLGLPDESYYRLEKFKPQRDAYLAHVRKMFALAGHPDPAGSADRVLALETRLAKDHWDRVKNRDDELTYNKKNLKALAELTPGFDWAAWLESAGVRGIEEVIVGQPSYFTAMAKAVEEVPLESWKDWLAWGILPE